MGRTEKPIVLITGAAGSIGSRLAECLGDRYRVVGMDMEGLDAPCPLIDIDLSSDDSVELAFRKFARGYGKSVAAVIHLAAYFDFTGNESPLYEAVNESGTRRLLDALQSYDVERLIYASTMLVHEPGIPGERIDERSPIGPKWAYPKSKARTETIIHEHAGEIPYLILRLAGLYSDTTAVPTLSHQIARIFERSLKSNLYAGDTRAGQSFLHEDDLTRLFALAVDKRNALPKELHVLAGEPDAVGYGALQDRIGELIHGDDEWATLSMPKPVAKAGAWIESSSEPIVPDDLDLGEKPFIRPFMIDMADDHYALDVSRARELLGWQPEHKIDDVLPQLIDNLKSDPVGWYKRNGITPPPWMETAEAADINPESLRNKHEHEFRRRHAGNLWAPFSVAALGSWLITSPATFGYSATPLGWSDVASGIALVAFGLLSLSWRLSPVRWGAAGIGIWVLFAPLVFWTPSAAGYLNGTLVGALAIAFSVLVRPTPGVSPVAARTGPDAPPGWGFNPSGWLQRMPIILLAFVGLYISRYLAAYQLGHIDSVWEPFFEGGAGAKNGTEEIITSAVSEAWPVPDAGVGALTYMLEILTGIIGSQRRWRTMPWLVVLFGVMIVPLGAVSITFIIIQPIVIGTWCTLCLIAAAAMLVQIPYSLDELAATGAFLMRRHRAGAPVLRIFFTGDTDDRPWERNVDGFEQPLLTIVRDMISGGLSLPWTLLVSIAIGIWLMFTRLALGTDGALADADHLLGALAITFSVTALAEIARPVRLLNIPIGLALCLAAFVYGEGGVSMVSSASCGLLLIALSFRRGPIRRRYGDLDRYII